MKSYDLRRAEKVIATVAAAVGGSTEAKQDDQITLATALNAKDFATEVTLADILLSNKHTQIALSNLLKEQKLTNKLLQKIYNPI